jgi:hypothetical protein
MITPADEDGIALQPRPITIPDQQDPAELVAEALRQMEVRDHVRRQFKGPFLDGWDGRVTIEPCRPWQHQLIVVHVDVSVECEPGAPKASDINGRSYLHWTTNTAIDRREVYMAGDWGRVLELLRWRMVRALDRFRVVALFEIDHVGITDEDTPPGFWERRHAAESPPPVRPSRLIIFTPAPCN